MKPKLQLLFISIFLFFNCKQTSQNRSKEAIYSVKKQIDSLYTIDQKVQLNITNTFKNGGNSEKMNELLAIQKTTFKRHIPLLKEIHHKIGYPTTDLVGKQHSNYFFTMVQHADADVDFQEQMLKTITIEVKKGNVDGKQYAYLMDRVQLANHKPQTYGTQLKYNMNTGQAYPKNLKDSSNVNKRRKQIGLKSIEAYLNKASQLHFEMNKAHYSNIGLSQPKLYTVKE